MKARKIAVTALMAALAFVLQILEFGLPFVPSFLKFDFSDIPALITSFALGPWWGTAVELLKNIFHMPMSTTSFVGELANFIVGSAMIIPAGIIYRYKKTRRGALAASVVGTVCASFASFPVNYFITYPFFGTFVGGTDAIVGMYSAIYKPIDTLAEALLCVNVPFTFVKGLVCTGITFAVYKKISPVIKKIAQGENGTKTAEK